ncbi:MAG: phytanoyl-CoA dioxygenase family protein [Chloroflexi bacterium]|nr:phytanoyl-CoA dioxygenase family protein [Chloroflexota bacterium]
MSVVSSGTPGVTGGSPIRRRLQPEERVAYEREGYVAIPGVFPAEELAALDAELDRLITAPGVEAGPRRQGWIYDVARKSVITKHFAEDERLLALIEEVVKPGIAIHSTKLVTKLPHSQDVCHWHQDESYYRKDEDAATHSRARMSVWVPLQDTDERNGCLWVVPGSHRWGIDDWTWQDWGTCQKRINRYEWAEEHAIPLPVNAGSVVLFSAWTWHHSRNNHTDRTRRAFIVSYQEATLTKGAGEQWRILRPAPGAV